MKHMLLSRFFILEVLVGAGLVLGCTGKKDVSLAPVTGKVTLDGKPLTSGSVSLIPDVPLGNEGAQEASKMQTIGLSGGEIKSDGTYTISTAGKEGAPLGKYKVRVLPPMTEPSQSKEAPKLRFRQDYTDANKTPLKYEVVSSPEAGRYDLKLTK